MSKPRFLAAATVFLATLLITRLHAESPALPAGPMQEKVTTACTECHSSRIILQQRLGKGAWVKEVDKMIKWGALVEASDHDKFVDYLSTNFPADKSPEPPLRAAGGK
jgi:hypothetical protein